MRHKLLPLLLCLSAIFGACDDAKQSGPSVELQGRVFAADTGRPRSDVVVISPSGKQTTTTKGGEFKLSVPAAQKSPLVRAVPLAGAPVTKPAPKRGGYVELYVKDYDAEKELDGSKGGTLVASRGGKLEVGGDALLVNAQTTAKRPRVGLAAPNLKKLSGLGSLPGNFDALKGKQRGKLSTRAAVYVGAREGDTEVRLAPGKKARLELPGGKAASNKATLQPLYRFDDDANAWLPEGTASTQLDDEGNVTYGGDITRLGWWAVGDYYDKLTCVRGCVRNREDEPAANARVIASGVDHVTELTAFAGDDGCFALDVRASAQLRVLAQTEGAASEGALVTTSDTLRSAEDDAARCQDLGALVLAPVQRSECPLSYRACGEECVDLSTDPEHCGQCTRVCDLQCIEGVCEGDAQVDASVPFDSGASEPDGGVPEPDSGTPPFDSSVPDVDGSIPPPDSGSGQLDASVEPPPDRLLTVSTTGTGAGRLVSTPAGIDCPQTCSASFTSGSDVQLEAIYDGATASFASWAGGCARTDGLVCSLTMDQDRSASAGFDLIEHTLGVTVVGSGSVVGGVPQSRVDLIRCGSAGSDCSETVLPDTVIELTATPGPNTSLNWGGACAGFMQAPTCTLTLNQSLDVTAYFFDITHTVNITVVSAGGDIPGEGTVTSTPNGISCSNTAGGPTQCTGTFTQGSTVSLDTAVTTGGFDRWVGDQCDDQTSTPCVFVINGDTTIEARIFGILL